MGPEKKKLDAADWEKELDGLLGELKDASSPIQMRKLEPDTGEPKRDANWVVGTVAEVSTDFKQVILKVPAESDIVTGDVFTIYRNYRDLPASKYLHTHYKQLYLGKAQVTAAGGQAAQAKILHRVTENPIKVGDTAIATVF